jgi:hypothetical protein
MVLLPAVAGGDPISWAIIVVLGAVVFPLRKLIRTLAQMARLELWAWFDKRHQGASKNVRKLIEHSSQDDLRQQHSLWRRPDAPK